MPLRSIGPRLPGTIGADPESCGPAWRPWLVADVDVAEPIARLSGTDEGGRPLGGAWILLRVFGEPVGSIQVPFQAAELSADAIAAAVPGSVKAAIWDRLHEACLTMGGDHAVPTTGCTPVRTPRYRRHQQEVVEHGPEVTAVVCTRDQPEGLARCLASLQAQSYPRTRVLVVDNAPTSDAARAVAQAGAGPFPVHYVVEPRPGLSNARNRSLAEVSTDLVAWIDDDECADADWLLEIAGAFRSVPDAAAVCGTMIPGELATQPQFWFEEYGGHSKGRGFTPARFSPATSRVQSPLFPLPPFGTGGNMAMRASVMWSVGGFDRALGAGTRTCGGEDTRALTGLLLQGATVLYQPTAVTRHFHRPHYEGLQRQLYGYGAALTAFYASLLWDRPSLLVPLLRLAPQAVRSFRDPAGPRLGTLTDQFPADVLREHRRGMLRGPIEYARERLAG